MYRESAFNEVNDNPYLPNKHWMASGAVEKDADMELMDNHSLSTLHKISSDLCKNSFIGVTGQVATINLVVGNNISIRLIYDDKEVERKLNKDLEDKLKIIDIDEEKSYQSIIEMIVSSAYEKGDVLISLIYDDTRTSKSKIAIELIEAGRIETPAEKQFDANVRNGVVFNDIGKVTGYWVRKLQKSTFDNIGSNLSIANYTEMPKYKTVNGITKRVLYLYKASLNLRPNQSRMIPILTPSMGLIRYAGSMYEAILIGIRVAACFVGVVTTDNVAGTKNALANYGGSGGSEGSKKGTAVETIPFKPNTLMFAGRGSGVHFGTGGKAPDNMVPFLNQIMGFVAMQHRMSYSQFTLDLSNVNYSSFRGGTTEANRMTSRWQRDLKFVTEWVVMETLKETKLNGDVNFNLSKTSIEVSFPDVSSLDPEKQMKADALEIDTDASSHQMLCSKRGVDFETIMQDKQDYYLRLSNIEAEINNVRQKLGLQPISLIEKGKNNDAPKPIEVPQ